MSDRDNKLSRSADKAEAGKIALDGIESFISISTELTLLASREIEIFTWDLDPRIYDRPAFLAAVKDLALSTKSLTVRILLHDNGRVQRQGHRLVDLARRLPSSIQIRKTHPDYVDHPETFMVVDRCRYIRRTVADRHQGEADYLDRFSAGRLSDFFYSVWDCSERDSELRSLYI